MCGIVGLAFQEGTGGVDPARLSRAVAAIAHRGPDSQATRVGPTFAFGHTRLAIIDLAETGAQPMTSADGRYVIIYNGELYNYRELRKELIAQGVSLRGGSDTEVLLECFALHGERIFERLNGIYALAIADLRTGHVIVARDPLGIKPVYVAEGPFGVAFASEIKSLLEIAPIPRDVDASALRGYLTFQFCPGDRTPLKAVRRLMPGGALRIVAGRVVERWTPRPRAGYAPRRDWTMEQCALQLGLEVEAATQRQMVSDAPLGAFLSGGVDSTAIVGAARRGAPSITCFTVALAGGAQGEFTDDLPFARRAATEMGVKLVEVPVSQQDMVEGISRMVVDLDEPIADPACLATFFIAREARSRGVKVLLSGAGGDDVFSGYRRHQALAVDHHLRRLPQPALRALAGLSGLAGLQRLGGRRLAKLAKGVDQPLDRRLVQLFAWSDPGDAARLLAPDLRGPGAEDEAFAPMLDLLARLPDMPEIERCLELEKRFFLGDHNLIYTDKMGMAAGVEIRVPLLDAEVLDFARLIPAEWKMRHGAAKWMFKRSQRGRIPDFVLDRPKTGFGVPLRAWIRGPLREMSADLLSRDTVMRRGLLDPDRIERLFAANAAGDADAAYTLFAAMCIEIWARNFLDGLPA